MNRLEIIKLLTDNHSSFTSYINSLSNEEFLFSYSQKWTAGQQLEHIYLAVRPVVLALSLPKLLTRLIFGRARRAGRSYEELVKTYVNKLENGSKASLPFIPRDVTPPQKVRLINALTRKTNTLCLRIETFTEAELDTHMLPHPILGKLTMREMLYFTIYHVEHHHAAVRRNLKLR